MPRRLFLLLLFLLQLVLVAAPSIGAPRFDSTTGDITGTVKDGAGRVVAHARVQITTGPVAGQAFTDNNGKYTLSSLPPGSYNVTASKAAYVPQAVTQIAVTANAAATSNFVLTWGDKTTGAFEVDVTGPSGAQLPDAVAQLFAFGNMVGQVPTDPSGAAVFPGLPPGAYSVSVQRPGFFPASSRVLNVRAGSLTAVSLSLRTDTRQFGSILGVVRATGGSPIFNATVKITDGISSGQAKTAGSGAYTLPKLIPGANYVLQVSASGYATQTVANVTVTTGQSTQRDFVLVKNAPTRGSITGQITDSNGATLPFTTVQIVAGPGQGQDTTAGSDGRYTFTDLQPGSGYALRVEQNGYAPQGRSGITVTAGQTVTADFSLATQTVTPGQITGQVQDQSNGVALSGVTVAVIGGRSSGIATVTNGSGRYTLTGLIPDSAYALKFTLDGYQPLQFGSIQVNSGIATTQDAQLVPNTTAIGIISGTVRQGGVTAISGATVTLFAGPSSPLTTTTNAQGKYQFANLRVGSGYSVRAEKSGFNKSERTGFAVQGGQTTVVDFTLTASTPTTGTIQGRIVDLGLRGIAGATVRALSGPTPATPVTTDNNGNFTIPNLQPGAYSVQAVANGYENGQTDNVGVAAGGTSNVTIQLRTAF